MMRLSKIACGVGSSDSLLDVRDEVIECTQLLPCCCMFVCVCVATPVSRQQRRGCCCSIRLLFGCHWIQAKIQYGEANPVLLSEFIDKQDVVTMDTDTLLYAMEKAAEGTSTPPLKWHQGGRQEERKEGGIDRLRGCVLRVDAVIRLVLKVGPSIVRIVDVVTTCVVRRFLTLISCVPPCVCPTPFHRSCAVVHRHIQISECGHHASQ
eukprot:GHVU01005446.1.p1 GENE.GHVU01005446.1~~GHVU01005446.1.p1  ORF type:complete len:208 (-),score=10.71 GHVU01005446.1:69-692(-)